jgi:hypothetical protein
VETSSFVYFSEDEEDDAGEEEEDEEEATRNRVVALPYSYNRPPAGDRHHASAGPPPASFAISEASASTIVRDDSNKKKKSSPAVYKQQQQPQQPPSSRLSNRETEKSHSFTGPSNIGGSTRKQQDRKMYPHSMIAMPSSSASSFSTGKYRTSDAVPVEFDQTVVVMGPCLSPSNSQPNPGEDEVEAMERSRIPLGTADGAEPPKKTLASSSSSSRRCPSRWLLRLAIIFLLLLLGGGGVAVWRFQFPDKWFPKAGTSAAPPKVAPVGTTAASGAPTRSPVAPTGPCLSQINCATAPAIPSVAANIPSFAPPPSARTGSPISATKPAQNPGPTSVLPPTQEESDAAPQKQEPIASLELDVNGR